MIPNLSASSTSTLPFPYVAVPSFVSPFTIVCFFLIEFICYDEYNQIHFSTLKELLTTSGLDQPSVLTYKQVLNEVEQWNENGKALAEALNEKEVCSIVHIGCFVDIIELAKLLLDKRNSNPQSSTILMHGSSFLGIWLRHFWLDLQSRTFSQLCTLFNEFRNYLSHSNELPKYPHHAALFVDKQIEKLEAGETLDIETVNTLCSLARDFNTLPKSYYALALYAAQHRDLEFALDALFEFTSRARHDLSMLLDTNLNFNSSSSFNSSGVTARMYCWSALAFGQVYAKMNFQLQAKWFLDCARDQAQLYQDQACLDLVIKWLASLDSTKDPSEFKEPLPKSILEQSPQFIVKENSHSLDPKALCLLAKMKWSLGATDEAISLLESSLDSEVHSLLFFMRLELVIRQCDWSSYDAMTSSIFFPHSNATLVYLMVQAKLRQWKIDEAFDLLDDDGLERDELWYSWRIECFIQSNVHEKALIYLNALPTSDSLTSGVSLFYSFQCARIRATVNEEVNWNEFLLPISNEPDVWLRAWLGVHYLSYQFHLPLFEHLLILPLMDSVIRYKLYRLAKKHKLNVPIDDYPSLKEKVILKRWA